MLVEKFGKKNYIRRRTWRTRRLVGNHRNQPPPSGKGLNISVSSGIGYRKGWQSLRVTIGINEKSTGVMLVRTSATPNGHYNRYPNG